jgi:hypothetical protein
MHENERDTQLFQFVHMTTAILIACSYKETMGSGEQRACDVGITFAAVDVTSIRIN